MGAIRTGNLSAFRSHNSGNEQIILNISTAWFADRNGAVYRINIPVDVEVEASILNHADGDPVVETALAWLRQP